MLKNEQSNEKRKKSDEMGKFQNLSTQKKKSLSPKLDIVFQALFGTKGSENITKDFLETVLHRKIEEIELDKNPILLRKIADEKLGILDLKTVLDKKEICNIELQVANKHDIKERIIWYWAKLYTNQLKVGEGYEKLQKTIAILITDFKIEGLEEENYHSTWKIMSEKNVKKLILTEKFEIDILELPKIKGKENIKDKLMDWLMFFENPESERVIQGMEENKNLKEAVEKLKTISEDEEMQRLSELREKAIRDEHAVYLHGLGVGEKSGKAEGAQEKQIEIAKKMLKENVDTEFICKVTELSKKEVEKLAKDIEN